MGTVTDILEKVFDPYNYEPVTELVNRALKTLYEIKKMVAEGKISREELLRLL